MNIEKNSDKILKFSHAAIEQAVDGVIWVDKNSNICYVNDNAAELFGYRREELLKMNIFGIDASFPFDNFEKFWNELINRGKIIFQTVIIKNDKTELPVEVTVNYVTLDDEGYVCAFFRDITERLEIEKKVKDSERLLSAILNHHFQLTGLLDPQGRLLMANNTALNLLDLKEEDVIGKLFWKIPWWVHSHKEQKKLKNAIHKAAKGEFVRFQSMHLDLNGNILNIDNSITPMFDDKGEVEYIIPEARDVTEQIIANEQLERANKELTQLKSRLEAENIYLQEEIKLDNNFGDMIGKSKNFRKVLTQVEQVSSTEANVLILGETGTGKELIARAIHNLSFRKERPLVKVNCAALPANLIESELFGHEKGAFTGALTKKIGRFELANSGTLFLDEIGELPIDLQSKLLRVLQEGEFERLGSVTTTKVDVRIIAATNRNLEKEILEGKFREDLFYRLNVFPIICPRLTDRLEDISVLTKYFIKKFNSKFGKNIDSVPQTVMNQFLNFGWPGNIRELENIIERTMIISKGNKLELGDWFNKDAKQNDKKNEQENFSSIAEIEKAHIVKVLKKCNWRIRGTGGAAGILGLKATTLEARMTKLGINRRS